ncbi:MAG: hypothetical protein R2909_00560 [Gemmatimonadales bacterium]
MSRRVALAVVVLATAAANRDTQETRVNKLSPLITVDAIEPCLPFWTDRLGFELTVSVPHGDKIGFAILENGPVELMYQSLASVDADLGAMAPNHPGLARKLAESNGAVFIEVPSLDPILAAMDGAEVVVPRRQTFYGMDELFVRAPCGTLVGFAAKVATEK